MRVGKSSNAQHGIKKTDRFSWVICLQEYEYGFKKPYYHKRVELRLETSQFQLLRGLNGGLTRHGKYGTSKTSHLEWFPNYDASAGLLKNLPVFPAWESVCNNDNSVGEL